MNKKALHKISYGLYVICSGAKDKCNGQIANVVFQITSEPPTVAISINKKNFTHELIQKNKNFTVSVLSKETPMELIGCFGFKCGREFDKFQKVSTMTGVTGAPVITDHTLAYIEAKVISSLDVGTHTVFVGTVVDADIIREGEPMTYAYYQDIKRGKAPETAPTYIKEDSPKSAGTGTMKKYRCTVCGYIYDPEAGDPDSGIAPGTPFEKLPDTWVCPVCGADKSAFVVEG